MLSSSRLYYLIISLGLSQITVQLKTCKINNSLSCNRSQHHCYSWLSITPLKQHFTSGFLSCRIKTVVAKENTRARRNHTYIILMFTDHVELSVCAVCAVGHVTEQENYTMFFLLVMLLILLVERFLVFPQQRRNKAEAKSDTSLFTLVFKKKIPFKSRCVLI